MTSAENQGTTPPNSQPPHPPTHPEPPRQVVVQPQQPDAGLVERLNEMGRTLAGLPEQLVNSVREATQAERQQYMQDTQQTNTQTPNATTQPQTDGAKTADTTPKSVPNRGSRVANWWFGKNKGGQ